MLILRSASTFSKVFAGRENVALILVPDRQRHGEAEGRGVVAGLAEMLPACRDPHVRYRLEARDQKLGAALRADRRPAHQLRIAFDGIEHEPERRRLARLLERPRQRSRNVGALSPIRIASSRRAVESAVRVFVSSTRTRLAATCARRVSAGDDAPASTRRCRSGVSRVEGGDLLFEDLDAALQAEHRDESRGCFGRDFKPHRLALPRGGVDPGDAGCDACLALAAHLDQAG